MNLPNRLTILRIILAFVFMFLLYCPGLSAKIAALFAFSMAALTDFYDGYIARKYNLITDLGKFLDPVADKIMVLTAFLSFVEMGIIPGWMVVIIILRELLITGLRVFAATKGRILAAAAAGKHKTVAQIVSIFIVIFFIIFQEGGAKVFFFWNDAFASGARRVVYLSMSLSVAFTIVSGYSYIVKNKEVIFERKSR